MYQGLSHTAQAAKAWPFEQARALLARVLRIRLSDAERDLAATLINAGKTDEAVKTFPALLKPVIFVSLVLFWIVVWAERRIVFWHGASAGAKARNS